MVYWNQLVHCLLWFEPVKVAEMDKITPGEMKTLPRVVEVTPGVVKIAPGLIEANSCSWEYTPWSGEDNSCTAVEITA